jgi:hypothetical protein
MTVREFLEENFTTNQMKLWRKAYTEYATFQSYYALMNRDIYKIEAISLERIAKSFTNGDVTALIVIRDEAYNKKQAEKSKKQKKSNKNPETSLFPTL